MPGVERYRVHFGQHRPKPGKQVNGKSHTDRDNIVPHNLEWRSLGMLLEKGLRCPLHSVR